MDEWMKKYNATICIITTYFSACHLSYYSSGISLPILPLYLGQEDRVFMTSRTLPEKEIMVIVSILQGMPSRHSMEL